MFKNIRERVSKIFTNRNKLERSESLKVESKNKIGVESGTKKRESSESKKKPEVVTITPKRSPKLDWNDKKGYYDQVLTKEKDKAAVNEIIRKNNWIDILSESNKNAEDECLLPDEQESKQIDQWNNSNLAIQMSNSAIFESNNPQTKIYDNKENETLNAYNYTFRKQSADKQANKPKQTNCPDHKQCMICGDKIQFKKESTLLSCAHRVHMQCYQTMKWKSIFKCNICERRRFRDKRK